MLNIWVSLDIIQYPSYKQSLLIINLIKHIINYIFPNFLELF